MHRFTNTVSAQAALASIRTACVLAASLLLLALAPARSAALMEAPGGAILVEGEAKALYDSNIFANSGEENDVIFSITPTIVYESRASIQTRIEVGADLAIFTDHDDENYQDLFARASMEQDRDTSFWSINVSAAEQSTANDAIGGRTESVNMGAGASLKSEVTGKTGFSVAPFASTTDYDTANTYDYSIAGSSFGIVYFYSPKLDLSLDYRYRAVESDAPKGFEGADHSVYLSANGDLLPKLTGSVSLGVQMRRPDNVAVFDEDDFLYASVSVNWAAAEKTNISLVVQSDTTTSAIGHAAQMGTIELRLNQDLTSYFSVYAGFRFLTAEYDTSTTSREDEEITILMGASYEVFEDGKLFARAERSDRDSDNATFEYTRTLVSGGLSFSF